MMDSKVSLNGAIVGAGDSALSAISMAAFYGKGVFTTIAIIEGEPFLWNKHWQRLLANARQISLDLGDHTELSTRKRLIELLAANGRDSGRARITFLDESPPGLWNFGGSSGTSLLITTAAYGADRHGCRLTTSPFRINSLSPLAGVKSSNYLERVLMRDEAVQRGFAEAAVRNERGEVSSAVMANLFWLSGGELFTPSLETGCLAGTTREFVLENLECREVAVELDELHRADAIFLTSAGLGVIEASEFDGKVLSPSGHAITSLLDKKAPL